ANSPLQIGNEAKVAVEKVRDTVAHLIGAELSEIIITSGGTESDNSAIKGVVDATGKTVVVTSPLEHHAVMHTAEALKRSDIQPVYVEPDSNGLILTEEVAAAITDNTSFVFLMQEY